MNEDRLIQQMTKDRRALHQIPELEFNLHKTHAYVKERLESMGYTTETIAETGLIAVKEGSASSDETIAFRSDMDALSVSEATGVPFSSQHPGAMHACGHDGHMALLLGLAEQLKDKPLKTNVAFLVQPAEEEPGGAKVIVEDGVLSRYNIRKIFGFHLYPELEEGKIGLVDGPALARSGVFDVVIHGKSAHGAMPHGGNDSITAALSLINNYQSIVTKMLDPFIPSVICIGTIKGGEARNIIAKQTEFNGTIRTFDEDNYRTIKHHMRTMADNTNASFGVKVDLEITDFYPAVINDSTLFKIVNEALPQASKRHIRPMMFSEDFSFYQQEIPGFFMMLGTRSETDGYTHPLHSCYFNFNEPVLIEGLKAYDRILEALGAL